MQTGMPSFNALGPATCLQAVAPTGISRRNLLPPLNAMPVVQVPQAVQCVLRKRTIADAGRSHEGRDFWIFWGKHRGQCRKGTPEKRSLNALGPATCLQAVAPTGISSRNSLPALNVMPVVQVMQSVQCVLRKRNVAALGRRKEEGMGKENVAPAPGTPSALSG